MLDRAGMVIILAILVAQLAAMTYYFWYKNAEIKSVRIYTVHTVFIFVLFFALFILGKEYNKEWIELSKYLTLLIYYFYVRAFLTLFQIRGSEKILNYWLIASPIMVLILPFIAEEKIVSGTTLSISIFVPLVYLLYSLHFKVRTFKKPKEFNSISYATTLILIGYALILSSYYVELENPIAIQLFDIYSRVIVIAGHATSAFALIMVVSGQKQIRLERLANTDSLTGLLNRRAFYNAINSCQQSSKQGIIILADADNFKSINDTHGHDIGDLALIHIANAIRTSLDVHDVTARFGGEEFIVFIADVGIEQGVNIAERIRINVENSLLETPSKTIKLTISSGVVEIDFAQVDHSIKLADDLLYKAKEQGRNKVCYDIT